MTIEEINAETKTFETLARELADEIIADGEAKGASELAEIQRETAIVMIANAEMRAKFVRADEIRDRVAALIEYGDLTTEDVESGLITPAAGITQVELAAADNTRWLAEHRRDAWRQAVDEIRPMSRLGREP